MARASGTTARKHAESVAENLRLYSLEIFTAEWVCGELAEEPAVWCHTKRVTDALYNTDTINCRTAVATFMCLDFTPARVKHVHKEKNTNLVLR